MPERTGDIPLPREGHEPLARDTSLFRAAIADLPDMAMCLFDHELRYTGATGATEGWLGYRPEKLVGQTIHEVLPPERAVFLADQFGAALGGERRRLDVASPQEPSVTWDVVITPVRNDEGDVVAGLAVARDVSESRTALRAGRDALEKLRAVIDNADAAIFMKDLDGRYILANSHVERLLGADRETLARSTDYEVLPRDVADGLRATDARTLERREPIQVEEEVRLADGTVRTYLSVKFAVGDEHGRPYAIGGISTDISDRKRIEQELRESEERFQLAFDGAPTAAALSRVGPDGSAHILRANHAACDLVGYSQDELLALDPLSMVPEDQTEQLASALEALMSGTRRQVTVEHEIVCRNRQRRYVKHSLSVASESSGEPLLISHMEDLTTGRATERALRESEALFALAFDRAPTAVTLSRVGPTRMGAELVRVNEAACRLSGYSQSEQRRMDAWHMVPAEDRKQLAGPMGRLVSGEEDRAAVEHRIVRKDGSIRHVLHWISATPGPLHEDRLVISHVEDMTERLRMEQSLRESEQRFSVAFDNAPIGMMLARLEPDGSGSLLRANDALCALLGRSRQELLGADLWSTIAPDIPQNAVEGLARLSRGEEQMVVVEDQRERPTGGPMWLRISMSVANDPVSRGMLFLVHVEDITDRYQRETDLRRRALHDNLTELPNRYLLDERMRHSLDRLQRREGLVAALYVDVDDFKKVNDTHGHGIGDAVLVDVARVLRSVLRSSDTAARLGGDEFVVLCDDLTDEREAEIVADRVLEAVRGEAGWTTPVRATVSIGIASESVSATTPDALLKKADRALQKAKQEGKNRTVVYRPPRPPPSS